MQGNYLTIRTLTMLHLKRRKNITDHVKFWGKKIGGKVEKRAVTKEETQLRPTDQTEGH
jgi:hypothetical protein